MADLRIVCTNQEPIYQPTTHAHIVAVGIDTNNDGYAEEKHNLQDVVRSIDSGRDNYYTYGAATKKRAWVETLDCPAHCGERIIRSESDATTDNNLDSLRRCSWQ